MDGIERWIGWAGAVMAFASLIVLLTGVARVLRRPRGQTTGLGSKVLRLPAYLLIGVLFFGTCYLLWRPLPTETWAANGNLTVPCEQKVG
ncbi:MAG: hypothetical protein JXA14_14090 [Anaerolineae bacterium]|nr:hypothetical protein [Anaerolineae bacterium]